MIYKRIMASVLTYKKKHPETTTMCHYIKLPVLLRKTL